MIYEIKRFTTEDGKNLSMMCQVDFVEPEVPKIKFRGAVYLETPMGMMPVEFPFPENIVTLKEAFAVFEEVATAHVRKMQEDSPRVQIPDAATRMKLG